MNSHDKFEPRTIVAMMMGYSECRKNYILYDITNHSFFVNRDVVFKETIFPFKHQNSKQLQFFAAEKNLVFPLTTPAAVHLEDDSPVNLDQATETAGLPTTEDNFDEHEATVEIPVFRDTFSTDNNSSVDLDLPQEEHVLAEVQSSHDEQLRRSDRPKINPAWRTDYIVNPMKPKSEIPHAMSSYIDYSTLKPQYRQSLALFISAHEPSSFK